MVLIALTMNADNDNDELSFISLRAATRNVLLYLQMHKQKREHRERESNAGHGDKQKGGHNEEYIQRRLSDLAAFENRFKRLGPDRY